jgi:hypothetical protein
MENCKVCPASTPWLVYADKIIDRNNYEYYEKKNGKD